MRWKNNKMSDNLEDMRSKSGVNVAYLIPLIRFLLSTKIGRIVLVIGVVAYFAGFNPIGLISTKGAVSQSDNDEAKAFVATILQQTENIWEEIFDKELNINYIKPKLVLFRNGIQSGCGFANSQVGPFYCPVDEKVYLDLSFFDELQNKLNSPGEFARAYVIAHEIGHHVQNLLQTLDKIQRLKKNQSQTQQNALQVGVELQADCYAGIWAHYLQKDTQIIEEGDIDSALNAASQIGDDILQKRSQGYVVPDSFTHGSSKERKEWFLKGYVGGNLKSCSMKNTTNL